MAEELVANLFKLLFRGRFRLPRCSGPSRRFFACPENLPGAKECLSHDFVSEVRGAEP